VLPDRENMGAGRDAPFDGDQWIVGAGSQIDDREIGALERPIEFGSGLRPLWRCPGLLDRAGEPVLPDQVLREDGDPDRQCRVSAR
jgi:hypothetical protein